MQSLKTLPCLSLASTNASPPPTNKALAHPHTWAAIHSNFKLHPATTVHLNTTTHKTFIKATTLLMNSSSPIPSQWATLISMCVLLIVCFLYPHYNKVCNSHKSPHTILVLILSILTLLPKISLLHKKTLLNDLHTCITHHITKHNILKEPNTSIFSLTLVSLLILKTLYTNATKVQTITKISKTTHNTHHTTNHKPTLIKKISYISSRS